eukprot:GHUV01013058.1.p1 GENE.GHUV01013058.1~~GHUV01013058.1.p1  ORF type:complete len:623 (+),score=48.64 GHUV01013058.1:389-2257(+)
MGEERVQRRALAQWRLTGLVLFMGVGLCIALYSTTILHLATLSGQQEVSNEYGRGCRVEAVFGGLYGSTVQSNLTAFRTDLLSRIYTNSNSAAGKLDGFHRRDPFDPIIDCPRSRPITSYNDWRFCDLMKLSAPCVVYSVGPVQNEYAFEKAVLAGTYCEVHTLDCTRDGQSVNPKRHKFHKWCLGSDAMDHKSLHEIVTVLNHSRGIDAMKIDVKGADAQVLAQLKANGPLPRQVAVTLHNQPPKGQHTDLPADTGRSVAQLAVMFMHLANLGYGITNRRDNTEGHCDGCAGFSWLQVEHPCSNSNAAQVSLVADPWQTSSVLAANGTRAPQAAAGTDPELRPVPKRAGRLVVSLSSFPGRAEFAAPTVYSIMHGTRKPDALYFWVPVGVARFDEKDHVVNSATEIPKEAKMLQDQFPGVVKVQSPKKDYGPATKLLPTLEVETDPDTVIITIDDDTFYSPTTVAELEAGILERPGYAIVRSCEVTHWDDKKAPPAKGWREWKLSEGVCKGFMTAYASAAYRREFLDDLVFNQTRAPKGCLHHDDVWFSAHLWIRNVPIWVLNHNGKSWPPMYHRPKDRMSISTHPEAERKLQECIDYFHWLDDDLRRKEELGNRTAYRPY